MADHALSFHKAKHGISKGPFSTDGRIQGLGLAIACRSQEGYSKKLAGIHECRLSLCPMRPYH